MEGRWLKQGAVMGGAVGLVAGSMLSIPFLIVASVMLFFGWCLVVGCWAVSLSANQRFSLRLIAGIPLFIAMVFIAMTVSESGFFR